MEGEVSGNPNIKLEVLYLGESIWAQLRSRGDKDAKKLAAQDVSKVIKENGEVEKNLKFLRIDFE